MPATSTIQLVVLWEEEVRKAAALLAQANKIMDEERNDESKQRLSEVATRALWDAFDACSTALHGADEAGAVLMLSARRIEPNADSLERDNG